MGNISKTTAIKLQKLLNLPEKSVKLITKTAILMYAKNKIVRIFLTNY